MHDGMNSIRKRQLHEIIFEADTPAGKLFDILLIVAIVSSAGVVMLESISSFRANHESALHAWEWFFTILFTVEYALRVACVGRPSRYIFSFYGMVDLLAVLPTYLGAFLPGSRYLVIIRMLRLLRIFRVLKLVKYVADASEINRALAASRRKISVFLYTVLTLAVVLGALMYVIEGEAHGFTSIPRSIYWAIVTLTTVGYGDISPQTPFGQFVASLIMILGYSIIAVPTGIVSAEMTAQRRLTTQSCPECSAEGHDPDAKHCKFCGAQI